MTNKISIILCLILIASTGCALEDDFCPDNPDKLEPDICGCLDDASWDNENNIFHLKTACGFKELHDLLPELQAKSQLTIEIDNDIDLSSLSDEDSKDIPWNYKFELPANTIIHGNSHTLSAKQGDSNCTLTNALFESITSGTKISDLNLEYDVSTKAKALFVNNVNLDNKESIEFNNISFKGNIVLANTNEFEATPVGGLIGKVNNSDKNSSCNTQLILNNVNSKGINITYKRKNVNTPSTGGLIGKASCLTYTPSTEPFIVNTIIGDGNVGGLIGQYLGSEQLEIKNLEIQISEILGNGDSIGGIIGNAKSINLNNIKANIESITGNDNIGGIIGNAESINLNNIKANIKNITGNNNVGGLIGYSNSKSRLTNIHSNITSIIGNDHVGGLCGKADTSFFINYTGTEIINKLSESKINSIEGNNQIGGICGNANIVEIHLLDSEVSDLKGNDSVGGMFGWSGMLTLNNIASRTNLTILDTSSEKIGGIIATGYTINYISHVVSAASTKSEQASISNHILFGPFIKNNNLGSHIYWLQRTPDEQASTKDDINSQVTAFEYANTNNIIDNLNSNLQTPYQWHKTTFKIDDITYEVPSLKQTDSEN